MRLLWIELLLLLLPWMGQAPAVASTEGRQHTALAVLVAVDWLQTRAIARDPGMVELNPILGPAPSVGEVDTYFAASAALYLLAQEVLPARSRETLRQVLLGAEIVCVGNNFAVGVRF